MYYIAKAKIFYLHSFTVVFYYLMLLMHKINRKQPTT